jgi:hypothetical protein
MCTIFILFDSEAVYKYTEKIIMFNKFNIFNIVQYKMYNTENNSVVLQDHHSIYLHITEGIHLKNKGQFKIHFWRVCHKKD